jgi:tRNA threonylcarbamoyladenosine biosynthesis protein TsaE
VCLKKFLLGKTSSIKQIIIFDNSISISKDGEFLVLEICTSRSEDTFRVGRIIGEELETGSVVCLYGDLGAGKTVLSQGIGCGLGVKQIINSPTFTLINQYQGRLPLYHLDLYRLEVSEELEQLGWEEFVYGDGVAIIEWPEILQGLLPANYLKVALEKDLKVHEEYRQIVLDGIGQGFQGVFKRICNSLKEWKQESRLLP